MPVCTAVQILQDLHASSLLRQEVEDLSPEMLPNQHRVKPLHGCFREVQTQNLSRGWSLSKQARVFAVLMCLSILYELLNTWMVDIFH